MCLSEILQVFMRGSRCINEASGGEVPLNAEGRPCINLVLLLPSTKQADQGWGLLGQFPTLFNDFSALSEHTLPIEYYVYIWQVSPQLNYSDTCQIWLWFKETNRYFCKSENFAYGEMNERSLGNPVTPKRHPGTGMNQA